MRITRWGEYGVLCCLYLAEKHGKEPIGAAEIASSQGIPLQYTHQILQRLRKGGVVSSVRGSKGGYRLADPPTEIHLKQVLSAVEGDTFEVTCEHNPVNSANCGANGGCRLRPVWFGLKKAVDELLEAATLDAIVKGTLPFLKMSASDQADLVSGPGSDGTCPVCAPAEAS